MHQLPPGGSNTYDRMLKVTIQLLLYMKITTHADCNSEFRKKNRLINLLCVRSAIIYKVTDQVDGALRGVYPTCSS